MGLQLGKDPGALALAIAQDARHRQRAVVVEDRPRHPAEEGERRIVAVTERLARLPGIRLHEARVAVRQVHREEVDLLFLAPDHRRRLAEVDLGMTRRVRQRHEHLPRPPPALAHVVLDDRVAAREPVLLPQPVEDPLRRVPLLGRASLILLQDPVDDADVGIELGTCPRLAPPVARRHRAGQHLGHRPPVHTEHPGGLPNAHPLDVSCPPNSRVQLHSIHPPTLSQSQTDRRAIPGTFLRRRSWSYFRRLTWGVFAPPFSQGPPIRCLPSRGH